MATLIAMAGLAEAAEQMALLIAWGGLLVVGVLLLVGVGVRSWVPTSIGVGVWLVLTLLFVPWRAFAPVLEHVDDPDVQHWANAWRGMAVGWIVVSVATVGLVVAKRLQRKRPASAGP